MKALGYSITLIVVASAATCCAAPVVLGLEGNHPLSQSQMGEVLLGELRCVACHARPDAQRRLERAAPDLSNVGSRIAPEFLQRFIASPSTVHAGTTMPDMLAAESADKRAEIARAIAHFLVAQSGQPFRHAEIASADTDLGKELFHTVGCIACHSPRDENGHETLRQGVVNLEHIREKYSHHSLAQFLFQPTRVRPSGRMPDMKLTAAESQAIAGYLSGKVDSKSAPLQPQDKLVAAGKQYFQQFNCAACHKLDGIPAAASATAMQGLNAVRGCLAKSPGKEPRFNLSDAQSQAIRAALGKTGEVVSDKTQVAMTLTTLNCIACHARDDYGGVSAERNLLFQTSEKNLGDDARLPPPLTLAGAKLQSAWLKKVLFDAESVRPFMFTRMPQFGEANLGDLPELFARLDTVEHVDFAHADNESDDDQERKRQGEMRAAGRDLLGDKGLYCVACHNFNGKPSPNNKGIDLMTSHERLRPSWFYHFMRDPGAYRPRVVMPVSWPGGKAVQKKILGGDTDRQIEAIWHFLSLGTSAPDPPGIRSVETKLEVTDVTRTYRGRSSVAGYRGIAVGFPDGLNYAFNAETGSLTAIWRGEFVRVDRSGQGSGSFNPAGHVVALAQDVAFCDLADDQQPWPLRPVMNKEVRVNPDPLYPKNHGYQFRGYYFDDASIPTFMYRSGDLEIEDRSVADNSGDQARLARRFAFSTPQARKIWFRALTGQIEAETQQQYKTAELRLGFPPTPVVLRNTASDKNSSELLLHFDIPSGKSTVSITYELLK